MTRDLNEASITDAVLEWIAATANPRTHAVVRSLVEHLHDFVRDVQPTIDEWAFAIDYAPASCATTRARSSSCSSISTGAHSLHDHRARSREAGHARVQ